MKEETNYKAVDSLVEGITAPTEFHEANFILGATIADSRELSFANSASGQVIKSTVQVGAVGAYKRLKPKPPLPDNVLPTDFLDWQIDNDYVEVIWNEKSCTRNKLLTFYAFD